MGGQLDYYGHALAKRILPLKANETVFLEFLESDSNSLNQGLTLARH